MYTVSILYIMSHHDDGRTRPDGETRLASAGGDARHGLYLSRLDPPTHSHAEVTLPPREKSLHR